MTHDRWLSILAVAVAGSLSGGCKDTAGSAASSQTGAATSLTADPAMLAKVRSNLDTAGYKGTEHAPPASAPKPQRGKNVWIISPGQAGESSSIAVNAAKEAGEAVGWKMTIFDGQADPSRYPAGIRQAVAARADGIIIDAIDCAWIKQPLVEARAAKVKIASFNALDCDDPAVKGEALFDGMVFFRAEYAGIAVTDYPTLLKMSGAAKADWIIAKTDGLAKVIQFKEDEFLVLKYIREGFEQELATCTTCQIAKTVDFTLADFGPGLQQKSQGALLQHPEANAVHVPYDTAMLNVAPAIVESGRVAALHVMGGEGFPSNIQLIRDNKGQDAAAAYSVPWMGYAAVDTLNSVFNGQKPQDSGIGLKLIDHDHNLPPPGKGYETDIDFRAAYLKAWGIAR
jgi:ribose transport system substrate-binding protein